MPINGNLPDKWDKQADVVVIGFGAAGAAAAITAQDAAASVLMLKKSAQRGGRWKHKSGEPRISQRLSP